MDKFALRTLMKQKLRDASGLESWNSMHSELSKNLKHLISKLNSETFLDGVKLGVYSPLKFEPVWWHGFDEDSVASYLLVHMHKSINLSYHPVDFKLLTAGSYGLELSEREIQVSDEPNVILVPGLAFTQEGERLGRGKAYFDTYLKNFKGIRVGLFFSFQEVANVYNEEHDEELDYIVTEKNIFNKGKINDN